MIAWTEIERPVGPQSLPSWIKDLHINWMDGVVNAPHLAFKTDHDIGEWPNKVWRRDASTGRYWAESGDGLMEQLWHKGALTQREDGAWETTPQDGFGGRHFTVLLEDGRKVILRGPWFGGTLNGWNELTFIDTSKRHRFTNGRPWHSVGGTFGLYITDDLLIKAIATFWPHVRIARVHNTRGDRVEPFKDEWDAPKGLIYEAERLRAAEKCPASKFAAVYWGNRVPTYESTGKVPG